MVGGGGAWWNWFSVGGGEFVNWFLGSIQYEQAAPEYPKMMRYDALLRRLQRFLGVGIQYAAMSASNTQLCLRLQRNTSRRWNQITLRSQRAVHGSIRSQGNTRRRFFNVECNIDGRERQSTLSVGGR